MGSAYDWNRLLADFELETASTTAPPGGVVDVEQMAARLSDAGLLEAVERHASGTVPITLVVNDAHRPTDSQSFLKAVFSVLDAAPSKCRGLRYRLLVASGTHADDAEQRREHETRTLGLLRERFSEVAWNDADDVNDQTQIGEYRFHRWMGERGLYVACGSTEPHYFAGVTGAHKTLSVGVMSRESIQTNHAHAMDSRACGLKLAGNPVHAGIVRAVTALERSGAELLCLNQLVVDGKAAAVWAGSPISALEAALPTVRSVFAYRLAGPADVIIASVHAPLDRDLYQADKGIKNTEAGLRDGGILLVDAACERGVGISHFLDLLRSADSHDAALRIVAERGYRLGDHKAVRLRALTDGRRVRLGLLSSNLDMSLEGLLGARIFADARAAASWIQGEADAATARAVWVTDAGNITLEAAP